MFSFFSKQSLRTKLILLYIIVAFVPLILTNSILYSTYRETIISKTDNLVYENNKNYSVLVSERLRDQQELLYNLVIDNTLIQHCKILNQNNQENAAFHELQLEKIFRTYSYGRDSIYELSFLNKQHYTSYLPKAQYQKLSQSDQRRILEHCLAIQTGPYISTVEIDAVQYPIIAVSVQSFAEKEKHGVVVLILSPSVLADATTASAPTNLSQGLSVNIIDENEIVIFSPSNTDIAENTTLIPQQNVRFLPTKIDGTPWQIVTTVNDSLYLKDLHRIQETILVTLALTILFFFFILYSVIYSYTEEIKNIASGIAAYSIGISTENTFLYVKDELRVIQTQFSMMKQRNNELLHTINENNSKLLQNTILQKKAELKILESQINPHFLYNALDSINWLAIQTNEIEISNMISNLGSTLRYSISDIDATVPLHQEVLWADQYSAMYRARYNNTFEFICDIEDETLNFSIYKMLLQPLIENAILHAFSDHTPGGIITLSSSLTTQGHLKLVLTDNGCGIPPHTLQSIQTLCAQPYDLQSTQISDHIGVHNVVQRLRLYYHDDATITIDSTENQGTTFTITLPPIQTTRGFL